MPAPLSVLGRSSVSCSSILIKIHPLHSTRLRFAIRPVWSSMAFACRAPGNQILCNDRIRLLQADGGRRVALGQTARHVIFRGGRGFRYNTNRRLPQCYRVRAEPARRQSRCSSRATQRRSTTASRTSRANSAGHVRDTQIERPPSVPDTDFRIVEDACSPGPQASDARGSTHASPARLRFSRHSQLVIRRYINQGSLPACEL
jgi:hypothetical protein